MKYGIYDDQVYDVSSQKHWIKALLFKAKQFNWQLNKDTSCLNIIYIKCYFCLNFDTSLWASSAEHHKEFACRLFWYRLSNPMENDFQLDNRNLDLSYLLIYFNAGFTPILFLSSIP